MKEQVGLRGKAWFKVLTGSDTPNSGDPNSVLATTTAVGNESAMFLCVVPDKNSRFPCVRDGQVGLEEAFSLATHVRAAIAEDRDKPREAKRPIIAIVDVKIDIRLHQRG
jgi:malonate decarboxylase gamma subunit